MSGLGSLVLMGSVPLLLGTFGAFALFSPLPYRPLTHGPRDINAVALTFDDGPSHATKEVLDILDQRGVRATFFMVGENVRRMPEAARMVSARGHEVAAHSDKHSRWLPIHLPFQSGRDAARGAASVESATGASPRFYRPPHGKSSPWMRWAIARQGLETVGWEVDGGDWKQRSPERIAREVVGHAQPGSIILLHDGLDLQEEPDRSAMVAALPLIIDGLRGRGFSLVPVEELLRPNRAPPSPAATRRVQGLEFSTGSLVLVALALQGLGVPFQGPFIGEAATQDAPAKHAELDLRHVEPAPMFEGVVEP